MSSELSDTYIVRTRPDAEWSYRFFFKGKKPYRGPTGTTDRKEAKKFAGQKRDETKRLLEDERKLGRGPMTFGRACDIYLAEKVPTFLSMKEGDARTQIAFLQKYIKPALLLHEIPHADIQAMAQARMKCLRKGRGGVLVRIKASTVNHTIELLQRIMGHAHDTHGASIRHYKWTKFKAKSQRAERGDKAKRAIRLPTEQLLLATINPNYLQVTRFALLSGLRATENLLRWDQIDWQAKMALDVRGKGRRERGRDVQLGRAAMALLQAEFNQPDRHPVYVFGYVCRKTRVVGGTGRTTIRGKRYPITYNGWNSAWDRCKEALGLHGKVRLHDWRHTFGTRNAKLVNVADLQNMMGHSKPEVTLGYVTVDDEAIREALDSAPMPMPLGADDNVASIVAPRIGKRA
jgi:hypothetical protein